MIKHDGRRMPVPGFIKVRVRCRNGDEDVARALCFFWEYRGISSDIMEYEIVEDPKNLNMIDFEGPGKNPVASDAWIRVLYTDDTILEGYAIDFNWNGAGSDSLIVAYEVIDAGLPVEEPMIKREILVTPNATHDYFIWTESEFLRILESDYYKGPAGFLFDYKAFVIKDGNFHELSEDDIETKLKLKI